MSSTHYDPIQMIERLVSFDTTSRESNLALIHFVRDYLASHGIESTLIHDATGNKANLYATVGPQDVPGIALSGHTDVVPVDGQPWDTDPFSIVEKDGRLYGRGTSDMKSFSAIALALVPEFVARPLKTPIHFALSFDEEVGCLGAPLMIDQLGAELGVKPHIVIVGEPTNMAVVNAHKGVYSFETRLRGLEVHSSATHLGVNAVQHAATLVHFLTELADEMAGRAEPESGFDPPYTTVHVGTIRGGTAQNIVPLDCAFTWEYRLLPGADPDEIRTRFEQFAEETVLPRMHAVDPGTAITTESPRPGAGPRAGGGLAGGGDRDGARAHQSHRGGRLRHRSRAVPGGRDPDRDLRARQHHAGAPAQRVHRAEPGARGARSSCAACSTRCARPEAAAAAKG